MIVLLKRYFLLVLLLISVPVQGYAISAQSAVVLERSTKKVLFESNAYQQMGMASTTKIMTALVVLEHADPSEIVTVGKNAVGVEGSSMWLELGEQITVEHLLYGLLLNSGNDAAVALAEHVGGTVEQFCNMMNQKAVEIGAKQTHFVNPSGLSEEGHYTTAYDLGLIACYALENPIFCDIVQTKTKSIPWNNRGYNRKLSNHNKLLNLYDGCDGIKTGFTKSTGRALVSSATREGMQVVAVTLNAPDDWKDHTGMLDNAFATYQSVKIFPKNGTFTTLPVKGGEKDFVEVITSGELSFVCGREQQPEYKLIVDLPEELTAPVHRGDALGTVTVLAEGNVVAQCQLYAVDTIKAVRMKQLKENLWGMFRLLTLG